jgi:hypothetical protein
MEKSEELQDIKNLLSHVNTIRESYKKVAQATGENFNVFSILGLERREVQAHSAFIAHLLNANGRHGFGDAFLIEFISVLKEKNFENQDKEENIKEFEFKTERSTIKKEHFISKNYMPIKEEVLSKAQGGYIDILISENSSSGNIIMIENKIYAGEQKHQLRRYHNAFTSGLLVYLTLDGKPSSEKSARTIPYKCMSYEEDIIDWLEECQKIAVDNPVVRETIKQYKNLIKKLTNQNINSKMEKEIIKLITENEGYFNGLVELKKINIQNFIINETIKPIINEIAKDHKLIFNMRLGDKWPSFSFKNNDFEKLNIKEICFSSSSSSSIINMVYGFLPLKEENRNLEFESKMRLAFNEEFNTSITNGYTNWIVCEFFKEYSNWDDISTLKRIQFEKDAFKVCLKQKIQKMLEIVNKIALNH